MSTARPVIPALRRVAVRPISVSPIAAWGPSLIVQRQALFKRGYAGQADDGGRARDKASVGVSAGGTPYQTHAEKEKKHSHIAIHMESGCRLCGHWRRAVLLLRIRKGQSQGAKAYVHARASARQVSHNLRSGQELISKSVGKPQIGGPFSLTSHTNTEFTEKDLLGKWTLIYFGFTHCPDICPEELDKMGEAVEMIDKERNERVTPIFVSVDPARDPVPQVAKYIKGMFTTVTSLVRVGICWEGHRLNSTSES